MTIANAPLKQKFIKIDPDVADVLRDRLIHKDNRVQISGPLLDPKLYKKVNAVLTQFGGKWTAGKTQAHVFAECPKDAIAVAVGAGKVLNKKQSYQFFETPAHVAERMVELAQIKPDMVVLEPSAGRGAIIAAIKARPSAVVIAIEIDEKHAAHLRKLADTTIIKDFMQVSEISVPRIVMNPPFSGGQDADHITHAFDLLAPGGRLIAIVGEGTITRTDKRSMKFHMLMQEHGIATETLPAGTFSDSGTEVVACIVVLVKESAAV